MAARAAELELAQADLERSNVKLATLQKEVSKQICYLMRGFSFCYPATVYFNFFFTKFLTRILTRDDDWTRQKQKGRRQKN